MSSAQHFDRMILAFLRDDPMTAYYIKEIQGSYDVATGDYTTIKVETPVQAILLDLTRTSSGLSVKYGTEILAGDKELYVLPPPKADPTALPLVIETNSDRIRINQITYKIVHMTEANPNADMPLLYNFMIRR